MTTTSSDLRSPFFETAFELLARDGYAGLKQAPLCKALGVTTGAFYHSFASWKDFTTQLLEHWHVERTTRLVDLAQQKPDPLDQLEVLVQVTTELPHRAEGAIRVWAAIDPEVAAVQASVDAERFAVIVQAFKVLVGDEEEAARLSRAGMYLLIGFEQAETMRDPHSLEWSLRLLKQAAADRAEARRSRG